MFTYNGADFPMAVTGLRAAHNVRRAFLAVMLVLVVTLVLLGWRLAAQDRQLSEKRLDDQREAAAGMAAIALEQRLAGVDQDLGRILNARTAPAEDAHLRDAVFVQFLTGSIQTWPAKKLLFVPDLPEAREAPEGLFEETDALEARKEYTAAIALLKDLSSSRDPAVQAAALVRIAGIQRNNNQFSDAIATHGRLAGLGHVRVGGLPAVLAARLGVLRVAEAQKDAAGAAAAAKSLAADMDSTRWLISAGAYQLLREAAQSYLPPKTENLIVDETLSEGAAWLWDKWKREEGRMEPGRYSVETTVRPVLLVWRTAGDSVTAFIADAERVEDYWLSELEPDLEDRHAQINLISTAGPVVTGLPWTVQAVITSEDTSRSYLVAAGLVVLLLLIILGGWFVGHAVERELAVARLQSDFVSVVSHEFRTPLTALCQLSELLKRDRIAENDRGQAYHFLHQESHRLRRLVEALLDFKRLESGKMEFRFERTDAAVFVEQTVAQFADGDANRHSLRVSPGEGPYWISADAETLRCVLWNLLENAVKYSPDCDTVWVNLGAWNGRLEIAIRDGGIGIPRAEQQRIFERFVRGSGAQTAHVRGTGIGLATAREIVRAHGGDISLDSEPGKGSTFRVSLPLMNGNGNGAHL